MSITLWSLYFWGKTHQHISDYKLVPGPDFMQMERREMGINRTENQTTLVKIVASLFIGFFLYIASCI